MKIEHLRALAAAVDNGTMERAARALHITPSAMSQRIRALESDVGLVLLTRTTPIAPTESGAAVLRMARQVALLEAETFEQLRHGAAQLNLPIAVNADSMGTWFRSVFDVAASWDDIAVRIDVVDQGAETSHLADGTAIAAVTSHARSVQGFTATPLGRMRYVAMARRDLVERFREKKRGRDGVDLGRLPMVNYGPDDRLQLDFLVRHGAALPAKVSQVPGSQEFFAAVAAGVGWGMLPELQLGQDTSGLVPLADDGIIDVPLYWHRWRLDSERLDRLTAAVVDASTVLRR
ncbi:ArgP/LysG family DNA-binding transcriptional regulator [Paramicrobacterium humi]|nr:ArgP/LysG family DNA-binding transcriptional regulator [Microbacterium humi]